LDLTFLTLLFAGSSFHGEQQHFIGSQLGLGPLERGRERVVGEVCPGAGGRRISKWTFKIERPL